MVDKMKYCYEIMGYKLIWCTFRRSSHLQFELFVVTSVVEPRWQGTKSDVNLKSEEVSALIVVLYYLTVNFGQFFNFN